MLEFLPQEIRDGLALAQKRASRRKSRLRVSLGERVIPILRFWDDGFSVDASEGTHLRGLVDVFDGSRHLMQGLIIASTVENGELICDFKRSTVVADRPPLDFWKDENLPVALLPKA